MTAALFTPFTSRGVTIPNRIVVPPMGQYAATDGFANDWHLATYGKFAQGGAGLVMVEAIAVTENGRGTWGDMGLWDDGKIEALSKVAAFIASQGAVPAVQIYHAGRKAATQRPWEGYSPLSALPEANGQSPWKIVGPSALPFSPDASVPHALTEGEIGELIEAFVSAAARAVKAGFKVIELHIAHGFLLHQFLSPLSNVRDDDWGGDPMRRMAFPLEVIRRVRGVLPQECPLWIRVSASDDAEGGRTFEDTLAFSRHAAEAGADLIDCSSGGYGHDSSHSIKRDYGYLVPYASQIREECHVPTMAVGLITDPHHANEIVRSGKADLVAIGREMLNNPNWPHHAYEQLVSADYSGWPPQFGWWLEKRSHTLAALEQEKQEKNAE